MARKTIAIDIKAFKTWLAREAANGRVFTAIPVDEEERESWSCGCPLASYARECLGFPDAAWANRYLYPEYRTDERITAPLWTARVVEIVDRMGGPRSAQDILEAINTHP
jgi:hypothetical protein